ncbi:MAG: hypothetical protein HY747_01460 [Elusimicrobia bacterium]|nr:hypothetical protein [Elusimicrobiota bacterium]
MEQPKQFDPNTEPATKADIQALKADIQALATKADLQSLEKSTKADLQSLEKSTKADTQALRAEIQALEKSTKADIQSFKTEITLAFIKHEQKNDRQFEKIEKLILSTKSDVLNAVDAFAKDTKEVE